MALSDARILFGVHSITPYSRTTGSPYGIAKVIGSASVGLSAELEQLFAGSNKFAWAAESKTVNAELTCKIKEYPNFLFELFLGATVTDNAADSAGTISGFANVKGSTVKDASNGISAVTVSSGNKANLKFGKYLLVATAAGTANLYLLSDIDIQRGTDATYTNDTLLIGSIDVSAATDDDGANTGLSFTKAGTPAFTTGDSAEFYVRPPSADSADIVIGAAGTVFPAFGMLMLAQKRATGEIFEIEAYNVVGSGLPIAMEEQAYSQPEVKLAALYDSTRNAVFKMRAYKPE